MAEESVGLRAKFRRAAFEDGKALGLEGAQLIDFVEKEIAAYERERVAEREEKARAAEREEKARAAEREEKARAAEREEKARAAEREERARIAEREEKEREKDRQFQLELAREQSRSAGENSSGRNSPSGSSVVAPSFSFPFEAFNDKTEGIDKFLDRFERTAAHYELEESQWNFKISQYLRGKAYEVYQKLPSTKRDDFQALKTSLLTRYALTAEEYRKKLRNSRKEKGETFEQFADRQETYLQQWIKMSETKKEFDSLKELVLKEAFREALPFDIKIFLADHKATSLAEMIECADRYANSRETERTPNSREQQRHAPPKPSGQATQPPSSQAPPQSRPPPGPKVQLSCNYCKKPGHFARECRQRERDERTKAKTLAATTSIRPLPCASQSEFPPPVATAKVNGQECECLYDTGLFFEAIVASRLITPGDLTGESVTVSYANTDIPPTSHPVAQVEVQSKYVTGRLRAAVIERPAFDLILGCQRVTTDTPSSPEIAAAVLTRAQTAKEGASHMATNLLPDTIKQAQVADPTLAPVYAKLPKAHSPRRAGDIFKKDGLLHRQDKRGHSQLVVPAPFRSQIMELGHSIAFSGHMGTAATMNRITAHYYWPGLHADVKRFVGSCPQCQKMSARTYLLPVPLGDMPVTGTPFQRVAVDIVGPLPLSQRKHRYILTLVDTCTMWAEAVPLTTIDSKKVSEALISIFTRLGFPEQILTDNGSQFTGKLMTEVFDLLKTRHCRTSPYHPQGNGQVERFNGTLVSILKKVAEQEPGKWDTYLPAALFAYREVPHTSTGMAPAMMLFGRPIAGPLEALKRSWTDAQVDETVATATQYVQDLQAKLQTTWATAASTLKEARKRQAKYYNKHTKERELTVGDQALLLLPKGNNKLELTWQGPYLITDKLSRTNYKIRVNNKDKVFHLNLLKRFVPRPPHLAAHLLIAEAVATSSEDERDTIPLPPLAAKEGVDDVIIAPTLSSHQAQQIKEAIASFPDVMTDCPGTTSLEEVDFTVTDPSPARQKVSAIPYAKREALKKEVDSLLLAGIVSPSSSPYSAGVVLLKKPSGEHRLCIDYRRLNAVTTFQAEPLPDVDHLFANLQGAKYFTRIDLSKGYYQIPIPPHLRYLTAFSTPDGHFEFNVMPFGLSNAPSIFTRMMRKLLAPIPNPGLHHFMDDILLATRTWDEHLALLRQLLQRLRETGLTARPSKCLIGFEELEFLGHTLKQGTILPEAKNVEKMLKAPHPVTKRDVKSFLGMCGFYQKFLPHFNSVAAPLSELTQKAKPERVVWTAQCEEAFQQLKQALAAQPVLQMPDLTKPFVLRTDASNQGLGAALMQHDPSDPALLKPVAYASRKLQAAEKNYSTVEKECLALVWAIQKFQRYLYGVHFTIQSDHQPLAFLASAQQNNARVMRWALLLQQYAFRVEYLPGKTNLMADFLSRHPQASEVTPTVPLNPSAPAFRPSASPQA
jgi:hypothetical protein